MTRVLKSFLSLFLLAAFAISASAQCSNTAAQTGGHLVNPGESFGQGFAADVACMNGAQLASFSFQNQGNQSRNLTVKVYSGFSDNPADEIYSEDFTGVPPANQSGITTLNFGTGSNASGSLVLTDGGFYNIVINIINGITIVHYSANQHPGGSYWDAAAAGPNPFFDGAKDLINGFAGTVPTSSSCNISQTTFVNSNSMPTISDFAQSFSGPCSDAGVFTHLQINRKQNVSGLPARTGTLYLYNGESVNPADQIYSQPVTITAPTATDPQYYNVEIPLGGGTGDLTYTPGNVYTYRIVTSGTMIPTTYNVGSSHPGGSARWDGVFKPGSDFYFDITIEPATVAVPTMGEWALIILALIIMSMGVVTVMRWESVRGLQTAGGNAQMSMNTGNSLPFNKKSYFQILPFVWGGLVAVFAVSMAFFGYEMTNADIPGALLAGAVGAYLIHLIRR